MCGYKNIPRASRILCYCAVFASVFFAGVVARPWLHLRSGKQPVSNGERAHARESTEAQREITQGKEWENTLESLSGNWKSADGRCEATIDFREIRFTASGEWNDLDKRLFLLGPCMDFITEEGYYSINLVPECADEICLEHLRKSSHAPDASLDQIEPVVVLFRKKGIK